MVDVVYAHQDGNVTGSAISLRNLLAGLDRGRFSPRVALFSDGPARQLYEALGIPVDVVKAQPFWTFPGGAWTELSFYRNFLGLLPSHAWRQYLNGHQPDILHVNDKSCLQAGMTAGKLGIRVVWHLRSSYHPSKSQWHASISARTIRRNARALIAISEDEIDRFEDFPALHIIHNSVDFDLVGRSISQSNAIRSDYGIQADEIVIGLVVTSFSHVRGGWDFLKMAGLVKQNTGIPVRFVIVSPLTDETREQIETLAREKGISENLVLTGFRADALAVIAAMDILVVCNHHGVLGRPPLEAMSVGTAVVAWQGHSHRSSVARDGETALLVPRGDVEALGQAVVRLVKDDDLRSSLAARGKKYAREHFDPQRNARLVERVYEDVLGCAE